MSAARTAALVALAAGAFTLLHQRVVAGEATPMTEAEVRGLAEGVVSSFDLDADPDMMVWLAWIESAFDPSAVRLEPHIDDASAGLMQTLVGTARWLASDMGFDAFGRSPTIERLMQPQASLYYGGAFLGWLGTHGGRARSEEWVVRSYNGGPGNMSEATARYWRRYMDAKRRFG